LRLRQPRGTSVTWRSFIARGSSFTYKGKVVHIKQIGAELGVGYVVEGSVRKVGDRVRVTAQLNDVATVMDGPWLC
jgi:TolB-like protein